MVNKASLLHILESIKTNTMASNDGIIWSLFETAASPTETADIFIPNATEQLDDGMRYYSLYDGNPENIGNPAYADIPKENADAVYIRYFDVANNRIMYVSGWQQVEVPPDGIPDDHRFSITDHTGREIDVTDLEWRGDIPTVNLTKLKENIEKDTQKPTAQPEETEQGGFRLWYVMIETGRNGETEGKGNRVDHKICVMATPRKFPTKPFMSTLNQLPGVGKTDVFKSKYATSIVAEIPEQDIRVLIFENSPEPKIYPSDDILDITQEVASKNGIKAITIKTFAANVIPAINKFSPPKPEAKPAKKRRVATSKPDAKPAAEG